MTDIYYAGSETEWKAIDGYTVIPSSVTIHYNSVPINNPTNHIVSIDWGQLEENLSTADDELSIQVVFDEDMYGCDSGPSGCVKLWKWNGTNWALLRERASGFYVDADSPKVLHISFSNSKWQGNMKDIPYDSELSISINSDTVLFQNSDLKFDGLSVGEHTMKTMRWGLMPNQDWFSFSNNEDDFECQHYDLNDAVANLLMKRVQDDIRYLIIKIGAWKKWNGSCSGMTSVMALANSSKMNLNVWNNAAKNCHELLAPKDSTELFGTQDMINYYHLLQYLDDYPIKASYKDFSSQIFKNGKEWDIVVDEIISKAKAFQESQEPLILGCNLMDGVVK